MHNETRGETSMSQICTKCQTSILRKVYGLYLVCHKDMKWANTMLQTTED